MIIRSVPIFFAITYINNAQYQSELLQEQTDTIEQLQKLYLEGNTINELSGQVLEDTHENEKLTSLRKIEFKLEFIKSSQKSISLKNDLIKLMSSFIIVSLLSILLEDRKIKLKKTFKKTMYTSGYEK
mgnify:CR=1 FL=1|tara:strand:- start:1308 stop:1691 length:384 start_codon:yes stop_codon:yes gene_type:complete